MVLGLGIDLCEIARIARAIEKPRFVERMFTPAEQARLAEATENRRTEIAAGMFAAKEAVSKALGTGFVGFGPADVEIVPDASGRPVCALYRGAQTRAAALAEGAPWRVFVSVTHETGMAAATAILEK